MPPTNFDSYHDFWVSHSGTDVIKNDIQSKSFNILLFLATAQHFGVQFLPLVWDIGRGLIGFGGTARIRQALINVHTSFAFKTFHKRSIPEERVFRNLTAEIAVLNQPFVREHPNISQLLGICWDISTDDDKPWPVLVFEKSHLGDLYYFAQHGGKNMSIKERLGLCLDIGNAITDMHANHIVHGDIKPENVLVFRDKWGKYSARVIDFGYSSGYAHETPQLQLPRSRPWNAPENDGHARMWTPEEAVKCDLFCLGMLYFWLLFEPHLLVLTQPGQNETAKEILYRIKEKLPMYVFQFLKLTAISDHSLETILMRLFQSILAHDPSGREAERVEEFLITVNPLRINHYKKELVNMEEGIRYGEFKIQTSIQQFYAADYRVRSYIAQNLCHQSLVSPSIALQAALCYYIGFGVRRDEAKVEELLNLSAQTVEDIKNMIAESDSVSDIFEATTVTQLSEMGIPLRSNFAEIYQEQRRLHEAEVTLSHELMDLKSVYSTDHILVVKSTESLAGVLESLGRWKEAEQLWLQVIEATKIGFGQDDSNTLTVMANLAITLSKQGRLQEAEKLEMQVLEIRQTKFGQGHPDTLTSMANLAVTVGERGRWQEAEKLELQVMEASKRVFGEDHPDTLTIMANLAVTLSKQGRWKEAETLQLQVLEISKAKLGENHSDTITSMASLASTYRFQGRLTEAEKLEVHVMKTNQIKLGDDHPRVLASMANLALTLLDQGQLEAAESLQLRVTSTHARKLGEDHPDTLTSMANLAVTVGERGRWQEAEKLELQVMEASKRVFGEDHPDTLTIMANLAVTLSKQGRWKEAEKLKLQMIEASQTKLGEVHPHVLTSMANLASIYNSQGRWEEAEKLHLEVIDMSKRKLGEDHPSTIMRMANLAATIGEQGRLEEAEKLKVQVLEMSKRNLGEDHPSTIMRMANLSVTLSQQGRWKEAEKLELQIMEASKRVFGEDHPDTRTSMVSLAITYRQQGRWEDAENLDLQVLEISRATLGEDHPDTLTSKINLANIYSHQGRWGEAEKFQL